MLETRTGDNPIARNRRLVRAIQYVQQQWLPINQVLLKRIRSGLQEGAYELDLDFLLSDIKQDFGLLMTCIREIGQALKAECGQVPPYSDPFALMHMYGYEKLKNILMNPKLSSSVHSLERSTEQQVSRIKECVISASAAEALSKVLKKNDQVAFSSGLIRQLGEVLVSWNYPAVYNAALNNKKDGFELSLAEQLGFSAKDLGAGVLISLGLDKSAKFIKESALVSIDSYEIDIDYDADILHLCKVSEALAKACQNDINDEARADLKLAQEFIIDNLGDNGLRIIESCVNDNMQAYQAAFPNHFEKQISVNPDQHLIVNSNKNIISSPLISESSNSSSVQSLIDKLYAEMQPGIDKLAIAKLVKQIIPAAGFASGCIMILDTVNKELAPRVTIGNPKVARIIPVKLNTLQSGTSPMQLAYQSSTLISETLLNSTHGYVSYIAGVLGETQKAGVLYLELQEASIDGISSQTFTDFKAIRKAFCDCLKLK
jgi:hypothetical protein